MVFEVRKVWRVAATLVEAKRRWRLNMRVTIVRA